MKKINCSIFACKLNQHDLLVLLVQEIIKLGVKILAFGIVGFQWVEAFEEQLSFEIFVTALNKFQ